MDIRSSLKNNPPFLLVVLLAAHIVAILLNPAPLKSGRTFGSQVLMAIYQPVQSVLAIAGSGAGSMREKYLSLRDARAENTLLKAEVAKLESEKAILNEQVKIGDAVSKISNWKLDQSTPTIPARVIGRDTTTWYRTLIIDKGTASGIEKDQPVVAEGGLVGRVVTVSLNAARVLLLTDERHATGAGIAETTGSRILGIVQGTSNSYGKNNFRCDFKIVGGTGEKPKPGEDVITSGQDGFYPKGLLVGKVAPPLTPAENNPDVVPVQPAAPLNRLEVVGVIQISHDKIMAQMDELNRLEKEKEQQEIEKEKKKRQADQQKKK